MVSLKYDNKNGQFYMKTYICVKISHRILLIMRNTSDKIVEKTKTYFIFNNIFPKILSFMKQGEKKTCYLQIEAADGTIILLMRFTCWITRVTISQLEYIIILLFHSNGS
jgi:hypothetical protein